MVSTAAAPVRVQSNTYGPQPLWLEPGLLSSKKASRDHALAKGSLNRLFIRHDSSNCHLFNFLGKYLQHDAGGQQTLQPPERQSH